MNKRLILLVIIITLLAFGGRYMINPSALKTLKVLEGFMSAAYQDAAGVWTIGYGHTKGVREGDAISMNDADILLGKELIEYEGYVDKLVTVELEEHQRDALVLWTYNLGPTNLKESTMLRKLNEGDYDAVPSEMMRWTRAGGQVNEGLFKRRTIESRMFAYGEYPYQIRSR